MSSIWLFLTINFHTAAGEIETIGPGRANILEAIDRFGSISAAAPAVDLTFRQTWRVVQFLNSQFQKPLIEVRRSGRTSGAYLTPLGKGVLARFREIQRAASEALEPHFREFEKMTGLDPTKSPPNPRSIQIIDPSTIPVRKKKKRAKVKASGRTKRTKKKPAKSPRAKRRR